MRIEPVSGHCFFHGCGGGSHCYSDLSGDLRCAGIMVPVYYGQLLQLQISKLGIKGEYLLQIFQVGVPAGIQSVV